MTEVIPLLAIDKQHLSTTLADQAVDIWVKQLRYGLFMDVALAGTLVCSNVLCQNLNAIVRAPYTGFVGDFSFWDTQGVLDPYAAGIGPGGRFKLIYITAADLATFAAFLAQQQAAA